AGEPVRGPSDPAVRCPNVRRSAAGGPGERVGPPVERAYGEKGGRRRGRPADGGGRGLHPGRLSPSAAGDNAATSCRGCATSGSGNIRSGPPRTYAKLNMYVPVRSSVMPVRA